MARKATPPFESLIDLAGKFVEQRKGVWDHEAWLNFLSDVTKNGFELTKEMTDYLGSVLESMKQFYQATASTAGMTKVLADIPQDVVTFIQDHKGVWGQSEREQFLDELRKKGAAYTDETTNYVGGILDSVNKIYGLSPLPDKTAQGTKTTTTKSD